MCRKEVLENFYIWEGVLDVSKADEGIRGYLDSLSIMEDTEIRAFLTIWDKKINEYAAESPDNYKDTVINFMKKILFNQTVIMSELEKLGLIQNNLHTIRNMVK